MKIGKTYKVRFWNNFGHLTLPERCNGIEGDAERSSEKLVGAPKECGLGIFNDVGNSYPWEIGNPHRWVQRLEEHQDRLMLRPAVMPKSVPVNNILVTIETHLPKEWLDFGQRNAYWRGHGWFKADRNDLDAHEAGEDGKSGVVA
jgi:hypothetical protein